MKAKIIFAVLVLFGYIPLFAADRYVSTTGSDDANGLAEGYAYATIQKGLDEVDSHSTLWIKADGTYNITGHLDIDGADGNDVDVKGYYSTTSDQDPGGAYYKDATHGWAVIDCGDADLGDAVFDIAGRTPFENTHVRFWNLKVEDVNFVNHLAHVDSWMAGLGWINCWFADGGARFYLRKVTGVLFYDCKFEGDWQPGGTGTGSGLIGFIPEPPYELRLPNAVINCEFDVNLCDHGPAVIGYGNADYKHPNDVPVLIVSGCSSLSENHAVLAKGWSSNAAISFDCPAIIINNTLRCKDGTAVNGIYAGSYADGSFIANNIIDGFTYDVNDNTSSTSGTVNPSADGYSAGIYQFYNCTVDDSPANATEIQSNPLFIDPNNANFRLRPTSPCLNTGMRTVNDGYTDRGAWQRKSMLGR